MTFIIFLNRDYENLLILSPNLKPEYGSISTLFILQAKISCLLIPPTSVFFSPQTKALMFF
jgi:hypothetical protein